MAAFVDLAPMQYVTNQGRPSTLAKMVKWVAIGGAAFFAFVVIVAAFAPPKPSGAPVANTLRPAVSSATPETTQASSPEDTSAAASDAPATQAPGIDYLSLSTRSKMQLESKLTDSHGVRYQDVRTVLSTLDGGAIVAFCGQENSKTPFGGYGGFRRFIASQSTAVTEESMTSDDFAQAWHQFCTGVEGPQVWF